MNTAQRIRTVGGVMLAAMLALLLHLFVFMVGQNDIWMQRSQANRYAFPSVPSMRGALQDRTGLPLAWDEPSTELALYYGQFRRYHVVGAAVHAATLAAALPGGDHRSYSYHEGAVGPRAAALDLLALPARLLRPSALPKDVASDLATAVTTVLSGCAGCSRSLAYTSLRRAWQERGNVAIGDVLEDVASRAELLAAFDRVMGTLTLLEQQLFALGKDSAPPGAAVASVFAALEAQRRPSLGIGAPTDESDAAERLRLKAQTRLAVFAQRVPFDLAARLKLDASRQPGLVVQPSVRRVTNVDPATSLGAWLGGVADLDRTLRGGETVATYRGGDLPAGAAEAIVPADLQASEAERQAFEAAANSAYRRAMLGKERKGTAGLEAAFDDELRGQLGMRFVERDASRREHVLFGNLQVESGVDVQLTLDATLQSVVEQQLRRYYDVERLQHEDPEDQQRVAAAMAMIDARTGDVLAYVAMQHELYVDRERGLREWRFGRRPGVGYGGNRSLGSVVKPFVMIEQLRAEALGQPCLHVADMEPCAGRWQFSPGESYGCGHRHGDAGKDPVRAIAESCNTFFFQAAMGMGEAGLLRAYRRFGLCADEPGGDFEVTWMRGVPSLPAGAWLRPTIDARSAVLPMRGIGYGVYALPIDVARAYAALATGYLPTLGLVRGEARPVVPLGDLDAELALVREGMRQCVAKPWGSAKDAEFPAGLELYGKTGTAEVGTRDKENNAWFAGFLGHQGQGGVQIAFAAVLYWVRDGRRGVGTGQLVGDVLAYMQADDELRERYLVPEGGR